MFFPSRMGMGRRASAAWSPADHSLVAWYDFSDAGNYTLSGSDITAVTDLSGNGCNLTPSNGTYPPDFSSTAIGGAYPGAIHDSIVEGFKSNLGDLVFPASTATMTLCFIGRLQITNTNRAAIAFLNDSDGNAFAGAGQWFASPASPSSPAYSTFYESVRHNWTGTTAYASHVLIANGGSGFSVAINNGTPETSADTVNNFPTAGRLLINCTAASGSGETRDFRWGEMMIWSEVLDSTALANLQSYAEAKWGV